MDTYMFIPGDAPLLLSQPHVGLELPGDLAERLSDSARPLPDTDWHVDRLYDFAQELDIPILRARYSRYVVDLNRPADDSALYDGPTTGLIPDVCFDGTPLYRDGAAPDAAERAKRIEHYWRPYHQRLQQALVAIQRRHGYALLFDAHSIRSRVPRLFEGVLPDFNLGSDAGRACAPGLADTARRVCETATEYRTVLDGRFRGGHITRHYGRPGAGVHALQLELSQATYMDEDPPYTFREDLAARIRPVLRRLLESLLEWRPEGNP